MKKIRITEKQYKSILLFEESRKRLLKEDEVSIQTNLEALLSISMVLGVNLTGHNKLTAEKSLKDEKTLLKIKDILEDMILLEKLIDSLKEKGMENPEIKLTENITSFINKLNTNAKNNGFDIKIGLNGFNNLKSLIKEK